MCPRNTQRAGTRGNEVFIRLYHREIQNGSSGAVLEAAEPRLPRFVQKNPKTAGGALPKKGQTEPKAAWLQLCPPVQLPEPTSLGSREKLTKAAGCQCQSPAGARCSEHRVGTGATREPLECGGPGPAQGTARCAQELPEQKLDMGNGRQVSVGFEYLQGLSCAQFRPVCSV